MDQQENETKTWRVFTLTFIMMFVEIGAGYITGSMALLADGWHMGTHAAAFGIGIFAYRYTRRNIGSKRFSFGPGKVTTLGGFASAVALAVVALFMIIESIERFIEPVSIQFNEAIIVAILGLMVNVVSAVLLMGTSLEDHTHSHDIEDHNLRSAYFHVLADALTSILAIGALLMGKYWGWQMMDPLMGIIGAIIILKWSKGLLSSSAEILLDRAAGNEMEATIRREFEKREKSVLDLKMWFVGPNETAATIKITATRHAEPDWIEGILKNIPGLSYLNVETVLNKN
ncbi:MAG: CDF family Co(II)/Ni(II) efflux transporter DmeF [FCB group bacterium]|nr:CDF family Co(II)/Ni(II) efflux transporter DmeF [FCB group bacterium]MBL7028167.1 CDF family Co(II)/Ni(II) efflux transporter DmeF [Candidatus Neomarinimicrobiota bacterium]MBL7122527.1 CDF family Co(II)/Ni(II) efflux transporter DmeF [Candidatus Neomarinimicrobiota bacterium]